MNAPITNPLMPGLLGVLFVQAHLRAPQTPLLALHSPSDYRDSQGLSQTSGGKGSGTATAIPSHP